IELGEIESALRRQPGIADAVVVVREDRPGDSRLAAYLVAAGDAPSHETLRQALRAELPAYMLPSSFTFLQALPQTPNGKIDRKALRAPQQAVADDDFVAPRDALEIQLAGLFAELLDLDRVS